MYGKELIIDLHDCNVKKFNRKDIKKYFNKLCNLIKMQRCDLHFWDDVGVPKKLQQTSPHTKGTSAIQFIITSNITIHTLDILEKVFINIFSCKDFDTDKACHYTEKFFEGRIVKKTLLERE